MAKQKFKTLYVTLPPEERDAIRAHAKSQFLPVTAWVRQQLMMALTKAQSPTTNGMAGLDGQVGDSRRG